MSVDKRTVASAHARIDDLEKTIIGMQKEMEIQFKDLFNRVKRLETIMLTASAFIIALLLRLVMVG